MRVRNALIAAALLACLVALGGSAQAAGLPAAPVGAAAIHLTAGPASAGMPVLLGLAASDQQQPAKDINVNIKAEGGRGWYRSPVIIGIAVLLIVLIIVVMATRGGGTTVVK